MNEFTYLCIAPHISAEYHSLLLVCPMIPSNGVNLSQRLSSFSLHLALFTINTFKHGYESLVLRVTGTHWSKSLSLNSVFDALSQSYDSASGVKEALHRSKEIFYSFYV